MPGRVRRRGTGWSSPTAPDTTRPRAPVRCSPSRGSVSAGPSPSRAASTPGVPPGCRRDLPPPRNPKRRRHPPRPGGEPGRDPASSRAPQVRDRGVAFRPGKSGPREPPRVSRGRPQHPEISQVPIKSGLLGHGRRAQQPRCQRGDFGASSFASVFFRARVLASGRPASCKTGGLRGLPSLRRQWPPCHGIPERRRCRKGG